MIGRARPASADRYVTAFADPSPYKPSLMLMQDPPEHTAVKKLALELFSKENLRALDATFNDEAERIGQELPRHLKIS